MPGGVAGVFPGHGQVAVLDRLVHQLDRVDGATQVDDFANERNEAQDLDGDCFEFVGVSIDGAEDEVGRFVEGGFFENPVDDLMKFLKQEGLLKRDPRR